VFAVSPRCVFELSECNVETLLHVSQHTIHAWAQFKNKRRQAKRAFITQYHICFIWISACRSNFWRSVGSLGRILSFDIRLGTRKKRLLESKNRVLLLLPHLGGHGLIPLKGNFSKIGKFWLQEATFSKLNYLLNGGYFWMGKGVMPRSRGAMKRFGQQ